MVNFDQLEVNRVAQGNFPPDLINPVFVLGSFCSISHGSTPTVRIRVYAELGISTIMPSAGLCRVDSESDSAAGPSGVFHSA